MRAARLQVDRRLTTWVRVLLPVAIALGIQTVVQFHHLDDHRLGTTNDPSMCAACRGVGVLPDVVLAVPPSPLPAPRPMAPPAATPAQPPTHPVLDTGLARAPPFLV